MAPMIPNRKNIKSFRTEAAFEKWLRAGTMPAGAQDVPDARTPEPSPSEAGGSPDGKRRLRS